MVRKTSYTGSLSPEYALLGLLSQKPAHGYELHQCMLRDLGQIWHISLSQTYNILNRLEVQGFIRGDLQEQEKLPARRYFKLTESGRERFETWLNSASGCSVRLIRVEFTTRLYFARMRGSEFVSKLIAAQISETTACLQRLQVKLDSTPPEQIFNQLGLDLRVRQLSSMIAWLEECRFILEVE